jgi:hypothetical protein
VRRRSARPALLLLALLLTLLVALSRSQAGPPVPRVGARSRWEPGSRPVGRVTREARQQPTRKAHRQVSSRRAQPQVDLQAEAEPSSGPIGAPALPPDVQTAIPEEELLPGLGGGPSEVALLEVQLGRLARRILKTYWNRDQLQLPLAAWLDLAEVSHEGAGSRITGRLQPSRTTFVVDADSGIARLGRQSLRVGPGDVSMVGDEPYISLDLLSQLFGVTAGLDRENAALFFANPEGLPVARRLERESSRSIQAGDEHQYTPDMIYRGPEGALPGLVAAYEFRTSSQPGAPTSYDVGLATGFMGGSAVARTAGTTGGASRLEGAWSRSWPRQRWLTQLRLGDGPTTGPRPRTSRGFSLGNAPITRAILVEDLPFAGALPPDWSVEAYRAGRLVGFDSVGPSGKYSLALPVQYGENPVDFVAYGPFGEVRTFNRTFRALPSMVRPGHLEYAVSAGDCHVASCAAGANLDLGFGASRRWTFRGGLDQSWGGAGGTHSHPYAVVVGSPTNALGVEVEGAMNLLYRASLRFEPSTRLRLTGDYVSYADSGSVSPFLPPGTRERWSIYGRLSPGRRSEAVVLEAQGTRTLTSSGPRAEARTGAAFQFQNMVLRPYLRAERIAAAQGQVQREYVGLEATVLPRRSLGQILGGFWLQGRVEAEAARSPTSAAVVIARNLGSAFRVEAGTRWETALSGPIFTFSLVSQLGVVRSTSIVTAPPAGEPTRLDQSVGGSVVWSQGGRAPLFSSEPSLERGGVGGRVFIDLNCDGRWQSQEPAAPGTRLLVGNRWVTADKDGRYQLWGVSPWEEILVSVDSTSLGSPWWTPAFPATAVTPTPNLVRSVDVPIVIGGVVEGSVRLEGSSSRPLTRPLTVVLTETSSATVTMVEAFSDGSFYRMGLRPGHYEATVSDASLTGLGVVADTVRFELHPGASANEPGPTASGLLLLLRSR